MIPEPNYDVQHIPLDEIFIDSEFNFRGYVPPMDVLDLAQSIAKRGLDTPITVQLYNMPSNPKIKYRVVAGHRRCTAHHVLGKETVPCYVRTFASEVNAHIYNLLENVERKDLTVVQEAEAVGFLAKFKNASGNQTFTGEDIGLMLHQSRSWVALRLDLMKLDPDIRKEAGAGLLSQDHMRQLVKIKDRKQQIEYIKQLKDKKLKGEKLRVTHSIEDAKQVLKARKRRPEEITELKELIYDLLGPSLVTRVLAFADGTISYAALVGDIRDACKDQGIKYVVPESINKALTGAF